MKPRVITAAAILVDGRTWVEGGGLLVGHGRVLRLLRSRGEVLRACRDLDCLDAGERLLAPGLVNAHAHLELTGLGGRMPRRGSFSGWVARLLELRAGRGARGLSADARAGASRCLATGTTLIGDVDTTGAAERGLTRWDGSPRTRLFRELLDARDPARTAPALARAQAPAPRTRQVRIGLAAHAPYSASDELLTGLARAMRRRALPISVHWSETEAEIEWLLHGSGTFVELLGTSPRRSGLDLLEQAGLLGERLVLVHGNLPTRGEPARLARAGSTLVHCPGSHAWFGRPRFPLERYLRAGVRLALGTDSLASNEDLDMAREMARLRTTHPALAPARVWSMATEAGARALGHEDEAGTLQPGCFADVVAWEAPLRGLRSALEALTTGEGRAVRTWVAGVEAGGSPR